jgi:dTDP-4-dehydrorhamnose 3,5-epimerase
VIFEPTAVVGAVLVHLELHMVERGFFGWSWCASESADAALAAELVQSSVSFNERRHTLRDMCWQASQHTEGKVVRCTPGAIVDVAVDLRPDSPTYLPHVAVRLDEDNRDARFIPPDLAHGVLTLDDGT